MAKKEGKIYYVDKEYGSDKNDGLDHGGLIIDKGVVRRNIHPLKTIQAAINKCARKQK